MKDSVGVPAGEGWRTGLLWSHIKCEVCRREDSSSGTSSHSPFHPPSEQPQLSSDPIPTRIMFSRLAAVSALAFAVLVAAADSCNTGSMQCCNHVEEVSVSSPLPDQSVSGR